MEGDFKEIKPGEVFYCFNEKLHFVGSVKGTDEEVYVFWGWNRYKSRRYYEAYPEWEMEIKWEYFRKTKEKRKLIY